MVTIVNPVRGLLSRHIQDHANAKQLIYYFGYASRVFPCVNDVGSCEYLDEVYGGHERSMLYSWIMWVVIGGILVAWATIRFLAPVRIDSKELQGDQHQRPQPSTYRLFRSALTTIRHHFLAEAPLRWLFGRTSRLQVTILAGLIAYLTVFTFIGMTYKVWITPVKDMPGVYNTRSTLGPWSDRIGILAYALTPLSVLLASRESILSVITGVPYQHFNFLHRWLGYIILIQGSLHTFGWILIEARLYQPQPKVWIGYITQTYAIWGVVALVAIWIMFVLSFPSVHKRTGYEFFRKLHYVMGMLYIGACWGHWPPLYFWLLASLILWGIDRGLRLLRTAHLHYKPLGDGSVGFRNVEANIKLFRDAEHGDVVRLDFSHKTTWKVGQHFYLCFPALSIWQSHPFTPATISETGKTLQQHTYIIRAKGGETAKLAALAREKSATGSMNTGVILTGPHGASDVNPILESSDVNVLCVAGGSGITYVLPVLRLLALKAKNLETRSQRSVELIWAIRKKADMHWIEEELQDLSRSAGEAFRLRLRIFVTRDDDKALEKIGESPDGSSSSSLGEKKRHEITDVVTGPSHSSDDGGNVGTEDLMIVKQASLALEPESRRPDLPRVLDEFVSSTIQGPVVVYSSGPSGMTTDLRRAVARANSGSRVWRGEDRYDITLISDNRLEW